MKEILTEGCVIIIFEVDSTKAANEEETSKSECGRHLNNSVS